MSAPRHIVDALECVVSTFVSSIRHNHRAAFILCDGLVEIVCREKIKQVMPTLGRMPFLNLLRHAAVGLNPASDKLGAAVFASHNTRNYLHHDNPGAAVDFQHCADAILDAVSVIDHCFPRSSASLPDAVAVTLRVVRLFSTRVDAVRRAAFVQAMRNHRWRQQNKPPKQTELVISLGDQPHWGLALAIDLVAIDGLLDEVNAP